jgi:GT2 family glycosyltransferase
MVCNVEIIDGELYSEDTVLFRKLAQAGFDLWLDPRMTCTHIGTKKFVGSFQEYSKRLQNGIALVA